MRRFNSNSQKLKGIYFGYPQCCIREFIEDEPGSVNWQRRDLLPQNGTGFIPCMTHTLGILAGEYKLKDLIKDRGCKHEFPVDDHDAADGVTRDEWGEPRWADEKV